LKVARRILIVALGCTGVAWGGLTFPALKRDSDINDLASRIIRGETFRPQQLLDQVVTIEAVEKAPYCDAQALRSGAIIRIRIAENSLGNADVAHIDENMTAARNLITKALTCSPTDSYLWLSMFWLNSMSEGFKPNDLGLLKMSYQQGPNEGWVMITRNHLALAIFASLPPDLANLALKEFSKLLQPEFVGTAIDNFVGPGWSIRDLLLDQIKDAPESERRAFAEVLKAKGYDIHVPGIVLTERSGH
jgi:hypothetical protein